AGGRRSADIGIAGGTYGRQKPATYADPFQKACSATATARPANHGAVTPLARLTASPTAKPHTAVNMMCAKGDSTARRKNTALSSPIPPTASASTKYFTFSTNANPAPMRPP